MALQLLLVELGGCFTLFFRLGLALPMALCMMVMRCHSCRFALIYCS